MASPFQWLRSLLARETSETRSPDRRGAHTGRSTSGIRIDQYNALTQSTVWACHRYLTQTGGQLPARVMRATGESSIRVPNHPVASVLTWRANPELAPFQFKETMLGWAIMRGNGVAEIERDSVGRAVWLWPIHPERITFLRDAATGELIYRVSNGLGRPQVDLKSWEVFHLRGYGDGPVGLSVIEHAAETIGWAKATEMFGAAFFGNGLNAGGAIQGGKLDKAGIDRLYKDIDDRHRGVGKAHRPLYLDGGMEYVKTQTTPNEAQFIEAAQHQVEEICRWFGVPPQKVGHLLRMTFNNVEQLSIEVVVDSITPWAIRFEEEANFKLFGQNRGGFFVKLDLKGLLRGAFKDRQEGLQVMRRNGAINADEWRELEDMGPMKGTKGGAKYIVEANMTTLDKVGEEPPKPPPAPAPAAPPPPPAPPAQTAEQQRVIDDIEEAITLGLAELDSDELDREDAGV
jgi:HK97 family phage portal protein